METKRLILRQFKESDYDDLFLFLSQRKDDLFEGYPGITYENGYEHLKYRLGSEEFYAIELKETHYVIGNVYFGNRDFNTKEIGFIMNKDYQRKGYMLEACQKVIAEAFNNGVHRIYAECDPRNTCSWSLLEALGFTKEGLLRQNVVFIKDKDGNDIYQDTYVYGLLESDRKDL